MTMNMKNVLAELNRERDALDAAISDLERLEREYRRSPGRPLSLVAMRPMSRTNRACRPPKPAPGER
jgi:hypothetical protein